MAYNAGSAFLQILPSFKGVVESISAEAAKWGDTAGKTFSDTFNRNVRSGTSNANLGPSDGESSRKGSQAGGKFADGFKARVTAALKSLPDAQINADSSDADRKIAEIRAELAGLSSQRVGVDVSEGDALAKVEALKAELDELGRKSPNIRVKVDAAGAAAELAAIDSGAGNAGGGLASLSSSASSAGSVLSGVTIPALATLATALIPIGALAAGAFATLPALIAGAASGLGALKLGFSGIGGAISAFQDTRKPQTTGGASTAISDAASIRNAANSVISAQEAVANAKANANRSIQQAEESLAAAQVSAANSVHSAQENLTSAEQGLASAEYSEEQAQRAVIDARQAAQRQLEDYTNQLADAALAQRQAQLDVESAKQALDRVNSTGSTATELQRQQAQLTYDEAVQQLKDLQTQNQRLKEDAAKAAQAGVDGNQQVLDAEHSLADAKQNVANASQSESDAQTALAQAQSNATRQVADAQAALALARQQGAQQTADAERALGQALAAQQDTLAQIATRTTGAQTATDKYAAALAGLSPAGQSFVTFVTGTLLPAFDQLKTRVQEALLPGIQAGLQAMLPLFQPFSDFIVAAGKGIGDLAAQFGQFLGSAQGQQDVNAIFKAGAGFMQQMGQAALILFEAFGTIGSQAAPIVKALGDGIVHLVDSFAKWVSGGGFERFLEWLRQNGPGIVSSISRFASGIGNLIVALAPIGIVVLNIVSYLAQFVGWLFKAWPILTILEVVIGTVAVALLAVGAPVVALTVAIIALGEAALEIAAHWNVIWPAIRDAALAAWHAIDNNVIQPLISFFTGTIPAALDAAVGFFTGLPGRVGGALSGLFGAITGGFGDVAGWVGRNIADPIVNFFTSIPGRLAGVGGQIADAILGAFKTAWDGFAHGFNDTVGAIHIPGTSIGIPHLPVFHAGGVVPGTPGQDVLAVLQAGEVVLSRATLAALAPSRQPGIDMTGARIPSFAAAGPKVGSINVYAETNADPARISQEVAWLAHTRL